MPLYAESVLHGFQIWRILTYPFFFIASGHSLIGSLFTLLWNCMLIAFFGGELEEIIHSNRFWRALVVTLVAAGLVFLLLDPHGILAGPGILTMFVLGGFAYMWPKREISVFGVFWIKAWIIALVIFVVSIIPLSGFALDTSASNLFAPLAGAFGAMLYLHFTYRQYHFADTVFSRFEHNKTTANEADMPVEHRIDMILDKISRSGIDSLSREERDFLLKNTK
ncbi:MAG: rhomboid family intramembrane serine protease [Bacteroidota bacterium]|nr:rhomboid family intramembrane serine protease [Bacteroidota bacterium]